MTQQSILHLVVNGEVFTINIYCFSAKILFQISYFYVFGLLINLGLGSGEQIYTTMQVCSDPTGTCMIVHGRSDTGK